MARAVGWSIAGCSVLPHPAITSLGVPRIWQLQPVT